MTAYAVKLWVKMLNVEASKFTDITPLIGNSAGSEAGFPRPGSPRRPGRQLKTTPSLGCLQNGSVSSSNRLSPVFS